MRGDIAQDALCMPIAGRALPPRLVTGCFFALGPRPQAQMEEFLSRYFNFMGDGAASAMRMVRTAGAAGLREAAARARDLGADELLLTPSSSDPDEIRRVVDLLG